MIKSIRHKGIKKYWTTGNAGKLNANWITKINYFMSMLDVAEKPEDMNIPGSKFHGLTGDRAGTYSVWITGNWRLTFKFDEKDAIDIDLEDYH